MKAMELDPKDAEVNKVVFWASKILKVKIG